MTKWRKEEYTAVWYEDDLYLINGEVVTINRENSYYSRPGTVAGRVGMQHLEFPLTSIVKIVHEAHRHEEKRTRSVQYNVPSWWQFWLKKDTTP